MTTTPALRLNRRNPNHHLYDNHGTWWIHLQVHGSDFTKSRLRASLRTGCLGQARALRDAILATALRLGRIDRDMIRTLGQPLSLPTR
jgi:hypothetical protein